MCHVRPDPFVLCHVRPDPFVWTPLSADPIVCSATTHLHSGNDRSRVYTPKCHRIPIMELSTKDLRTHARLVLDAVERGETVTITYRGRPSARVVRIEESEPDAVKTMAACELFGLWADRDDLNDVTDLVRSLRRSRYP
jgi:prevent-host-death family protein